MAQTKLLIVTTSPWPLKWRTLDKKLEVIAHELDSEVTIEYHKVTPEVKNGRITHEWFDDLRRQFPQYDDVGLHILESQKKKLKIKPNLHGSRQNDKDNIGEFYFWANEHTLRNGYNQFIETCLHEMRHELCARYGIKDDTHELHKKHGTIVGQFEIFKQKRKQRQTLTELLRQTLITLVRKLMQPPQELALRVPKEYKEKISQDYGVKNSAYKLTGRHIGVDWAMPIGTPCYAPWDGKITVTGTHGSLGHFCYFEYDYQGKKRVERFLHLKSVPAKGTYKRGATIAYSGNTGFSTGPHLHVDGWWDEVNTGLINKTNWNTLTYDPNNA